MTTGFKKGKKFIPTSSSKGSLRTVSKEDIHKRSGTPPSSVGNAEMIRKKSTVDHPSLDSLTAYNVVTKKKEKIQNPKVVTLKNGRKAVQGTGSNGNKLTRIISNDHATHLSK